MLAHYGTISEQFYASRETSPTVDNGNRVTRPLLHDKWSKGKDGFLVIDIWGTEAGSSVPSTPTVFLHRTEDSMYLCSHQYKNLTVLFLFPVSSMVNGEQGVSVVKQQFLENVSSLFCVVISEMNINGLYVSLVLLFVGHDPESLEVNLTNYAVVLT